MTKRMRKKRLYRRIAFGVGFMPFCWRWGFDRDFDWTEPMLCIGPLRLSWRGW